MQNPRCATSVLCFSVLFIALDELSYPYIMSHNSMSYSQVRGHLLCSWGAERGAIAKVKATLQQHPSPPLWMKDSRSCFRFPQASRSPGQHVEPRDRAPSAQGSVITITPLRVHRWFSNPSFHLLLTTLGLSSSLSKYLCGPSICHPWPKSPWPSILTSITALHGHSGTLSSLSPPKLLITPREVLDGITGD